MKSKVRRFTTVAAVWCVVGMSARAADVEVELGSSESFLVKNNSGVTQAVITAAGKAGIGAAAGTHRLVIRSGDSGASGSTLMVENTNAAGIAVITDTVSADVNTLLSQHGAGDFLYCDSYDATSNWQRRIFMRKDGSIKSRGLTLVDGASSGSQYANLYFSSGSTNAFGIQVNSAGAPALIVRSTQNVGIGTTDPGSHRLSVKSNTAGTAGSTVEIENTNSAGIAAIISTWSSDVNTILGQHGAGDFLYCDSFDGASNWQRVIRLARDGTVECKVLSITGGSDLAEPFEVSDEEGAAAPDPGVVMVIDPEHEGQLKVSARAYDRCVAGIVSGAGGVSPGVLMQQAGTEASGRHPVALTGRVYCFADATGAPIQPGDLLTTSDTPGHAMKATDSARAQGAILGKAMTALPEGRGLVLVLVTLQ